MIILRSINLVYFQLYQSSNAVQVLMIHNPWKIYCMSFKAVQIITKQIRDGATLLFLIIWLFDTTFFFECFPINIDRHNRIVTGILAPWYIINILKWPYIKSLECCNVVNQQKIYPLIYLLFFGIISANLYNSICFFNFARWWEKTLVLL